MPSAEQSNRAPLLPSERAVLDVVRRLEPIPRADITSHVEITQQSVHRITEKLIQIGLITAGAPLRRGRGQPSAVLELVPRAAVSVGVSINTDSMVLALVDLGGRTIEEVVLRQAPVNRRASLQVLRETFERMLRRNGIAPSQLIGAGVAMTGFFVPGGGVNAPEPLRDWSLIDLRPELTECFRLPVWLENGATTGAIGERLRGAGRWADTFVYFSFNYGFGMGLVLDRRPFFGSHRNAGEVHLFPKGEVENRPALRSLIEELHRNGIAIDSVADLKDRFDPAWPGVEAWIGRTLPQLDRAVNAIAGLIDPDAIVFGGQIPPALGALLIERATFWGPHRYGVGPELPRLVLSEANGDPAATGAAMLPLYSLFLP